MAPTAWRSMVSGTLSLPCEGCFSPFPHGTCSLSVSARIQPWRMVPPDSRRVPRAPRYSGYRYASRNYGYGAVILCGAAFQRLPLDTQVQSPGPTTPARPTRDTRRFGLFPVRSPLLGESLVYFLFLRVLRCFSSPRLPLYTSCTDNYPSGNCVVPFGNPWIKGYLHLPIAYRSLSRPSSPPRAKASTRRPNFLSPLMCRQAHSSYYQL